jgi:parallel beta-helix repeat protein
VNKPLQIIGENTISTMISASYGTVMHIISDNVLISGFSMTTTGHVYKVLEIGIDVNGYNAIIRNVNIAHTEFGIFLNTTQNITLLDNDLGADGVFISGDDLINWNTHTIVNTTVNNKSLFYMKNTQQGIVPTDIGQIILSNCSNMKILSQNLSLIGGAIQLGFCTNITIENNSIWYSTYMAIHCYHSSYNTIYFNTLSNSSYIGILLEESNDNTVFNNIIADTQHQEYDETALYLYDSSRNLLSSNQIINSQAEGIILYNSYENIIARNNMSCREVGIQQLNGLYLFGCNNNIITDNHLYHNAYSGIGLSTIVLSDGTYIGSHNNSVINNTLNHCGQGIDIVVNSSYNIVRKNTISSAYFGIGLVLLANSNTIENNSFSGVDFLDDGRIISTYGIDNILSSDNNWYTNNTIQNFYTGVFIGGSTQNIFRGNHVVGNLKGLKINNVKQTRIENNTFAFNIVSALFINCYSRWSGNYWGRPRILPRPIVGTILHIPMIQFDWNPSFIPPTNLLSINESPQFPSVYKIQEKYTPSLLIAQERIIQFPSSVPEIITYQYNFTNTASFP